MARRVILLALVVAACTPTVPSTPGVPSTAVLPAATTATPASAPPSMAPSPSPELGGVITARYPDGLPMWMGGSFVHRGPEAIDFARGRTDDKSFLVAGWATYFGYPVSCPLFMDGSSWDRDCIRVGLTDEAGTVQKMTNAVTFRDLLHGPTRIHLLLGPVVVAVHARDPRAGECTPDPAVCSAMMVAERVVWNGDAATQPGPIAGPDLAAAIKDAQGSVATPYVADTQLDQCRMPGLAIYQVDVPDDVAPLVTCANLASSPEVLRRALDQPPGVAATLRPKAVVMEARSGLHGVLTAHVTYRWLVVKNVALMVRTHATPTAEDRALLEELVALLSRPPV